VILLLPPVTSLLVPPPLPPLPLPRWLLHFHWELMKEAQK